MLTAQNTTNPAPLRKLGAAELAVWRTLLTHTANSASSPLQSLGLGVSDPGPAIRIGAETSIELQIENFTSHFGCKYLQSGF